jgi:hypothetical protein
MLSVALFLAVINKALVDYIVAPIRQKFPEADLWWIVYVALATGGVIGWVSGVNILGEMLPDVAGRILTAVFIGGGSSLIHDVFDAE